MRRLVLVLSGLLLLMACSLSSTTPAAPTRVPLLPTADSTAQAHASAGQGAACVHGTVSHG